MINVITVVSLLVFGICILNDWKLLFESSSYNSGFMNEAPNLNLKFPIDKSINFEIEYCASSALKKTFKEYSNILKVKYPCSKITGKISRPDGIKYLVAMFFKYFTFLIIPAVICGKKLETIIRPNQYLNVINRHKGKTILITILIGSLTGRMLMSTGAFEIFTNDKLTWSKLENNYIPHIDTILNRINNTLTRQGID